MRDNMNNQNIRITDIYSPDKLNELNIDDRVLIKNHDCKGVIFKIIVEKEVIYYGVEYKDNNGKIEEGLFFAKELLKEVK